MSKYGQIESLKDNLTLTITAKIECVICGKIIEDVIEDENEAGFEILKQNLANEAYKKGWRESSSDVYDHIGIHCKDCHEHRNNEEYFQKNYF